KKVLLPRREAGCPMADMVSPEQARRMKADHPGAPLVLYVDSSAAVKAECDICCTSGNVLKVVRSLPDETILMAPDRNLANYAKRMVPEKNVVIHDGFCPSHEIMRAEDILAARTAHPDALFIAHPECRAEVLDLADEICSTSGMITVCEKNPAREFIIGTEITMVDVLAKKYPAKCFYPALIFSSCPTMRMTRLEDLAEALEKEQHEIQIEETIRLRAYDSVKRMIELA
ncbi:MAG: quinolinate synthase NadA, partial [Kiritimatiellae bacterium]|nr:quinolinate synthase NadA [Kiritimatiellia bacterium]